MIKIEVDRQEFMMIKAALVERGRLLKGLNPDSHPNAKEASERHYALAEKLHNL